METSNGRHWYTAGKKTPKQSERVTSSHKPRNVARVAFSRTLHLRFIVLFTCHSLLTYALYLVTAVSRMRHQHC